MTENNIYNTDSTSVEITYNDATEGTRDNSSSLACAPCDGEQSCGERRFTQDELDDLIRERLKRERRKSQALSDVKSLVDGLREKGIIGALSYPEAANELEALLSRHTSDGEDGETAPCGVGDCEAVEGRCAAQEQSVAEEEGGEDYTTSLARLLATHPEAADDGILGSAGFRGFMDICGMPLCDAYEIYKDACTKGPDTIRRERQAMTSLSSTGFSGSSAVEAQDLGITLSPTQRRLARENGISYREYASLLGDVPSAEHLKKDR